MLQKRWKKRLSSCIATALALTCMLSSMPVLAAPAGDDVTNLAAGRQYTTTATTSWDTSDKSYADRGGMLTDGAIHTDDAAFDTGDDLVGYKIDSTVYYDWVIDLGGKQEVSNFAIHGWAVNDYAWYLWNIANYTVSYLDDGGQWQVAYESEEYLPYDADTPACYTWSGDFEQPVTTSQIKFSIKGWSTGLMLSELEIFGVQLEEPVDPEEPAEETRDNLALNKPYTKSDPYMQDGVYTYPDTNDCELTDGIIAGDSYSDPNWVGFNGVAGEERFVQIDLGQPYDIDKVRFTYFAYSGAGIYAPAAAKVTYSLDNNSFYDFPADFGLIDASTGSHTLEASGEAVTARYIRLTATVGTNWLFLSEIEAYGGEASLDPNVPYLSTNLPATMDSYAGYDFDLEVIPIIGNMGEVTYEWTKDGAPLSETTGTLTVTNAQPEDSGLYQVKVTNHYNGQDYVTDSVACTVTVAEIQDAKTLLEEFKGNVPTIEDGKVVIPDSKTTYYDVVIGGSDRETIIDLDGNVYEPLFDTTVNLVYKAVSTTDETDYANADYNVQVVVPGKYTKSASDNQAPSTLPAIREWKGNTGFFELTDTSAIIANTQVEKAVAEKMVTFFKNVLKRDISVKEGTPAAGDIQLMIDSSIPEMGEEGYYMDVTDTVVVRAPQETGLLYGAITVVQSLYSSEDQISIPQGIARDYPAYKVRGAFLDVARMAFPLDYLEEMTKYMAWFKMNEFHLHLNDGASQNYNPFRLESNLEGLTAEDVYYTKEEYKEFQDTAADWGVEILSEIETPGHAGAFNGVPGIKMIDNNYMDINDPETVETMKGLFDEMLDGDDPVFRNSVVHIGTDEYHIGDPKQLDKYVYELSSHLAEKGVNMRFWGAYLNNSGVPEGVEKAIPGSQANYWASSGEWDNTLTPQQMMDYGYDLINSNGFNLYIVPGGVEYSDTLNHVKLYNSWDVNHFDGAGKDTNIMPLGHPQVLGANFLIWNDRGTANVGFSIYDVFNRFQNGVTILAEKTWYGPASEDQSYSDFAKRDKTFKDITGSANPARKVNSETQTLVNIDFENTESNVAYDLSNNHLDATITNGSFVNDNGSTVVSFDGNGSMSLPVSSIGFPYTASFDLKVTEEPAPNTKLFSSVDGTFYLNIDGTGKMGFKRDGFKVIVPDEQVEFDREEGYTFTFDYELPLDTWVNITLRSDKQFTYLDVGGNTYQAVNSVEKLPYPKPNPLDESSTSLLSTGTMFENMNCMVDNLVIKNPDLDPDSTEENPNLAYECDVTTSLLADGSSAGRDFSPETLTNGIKNDINNRISFDTSTETTWAIIDLGKSKDINLIKVFFYESCPEYKISISEDGETWTELLHETEGFNGRPADDQDLVIDVSFATQKARFVKYEGLQKFHTQWGDYHGGLSEMEVYNMQSGGYSVTVSETTGGTVTVDKTTANEGDQVTVTVTPDTGYELETLTVDGETVTVENGSYTFTMPAKDVTIEATFVLTEEPVETYDIIIGSMENGTVISDKQTAAEGETVTLTITPNTNYELETLTVDGEAVTVENGSYTFAMPANDVTIEATFVLTEEPVETYDIIIGSVENGTVTADKQTAAEGETVTLTITPDKGYAIDSVQVNSKAITATAGVYSFTMPGEDAEVTVIFRKNDVETSYSITVAPTSDGVVVADKTTATAGEVVTLTFVPDYGYELYGIWYNQIQLTEQNGSYSFVMPAEDVTITARFVYVGTDIGGGWSGGGSGGSSNLSLIHISEPTRH